MIRRYHILLLSVLLLGQPLGTYGQSVPEKVLVVGLDTGQFFSNVFYIEDLAFYNDMSEDKVIKLYADRLDKSLENTRYEQYQYVVPNSKDLEIARLILNYSNAQNNVGEDYVRSDIPRQDQRDILRLMSSYNAKYLLTINFYDIHAEDLPDKIADHTPADHIIHYNIYNHRLSSLKGGTFTKRPRYVQALAQDRIYETFAYDILLHIQAFTISSSTEEAQKNYETLSKTQWNKRYGLDDGFGFGGSLGVGAPYGGIGLEAVWFFHGNLDLNVGLGFDFSGFKIGAGSRYYFKSPKPSLRPFIGLGYAYASGLEFNLGGERDDDGNQLDPDDVSRHKIFSDHAIHLRGGLSILNVDESFSILPTVGYSYPIQGRVAKLQSGRDSDFRNSLVDFMAVGGIEVSVTLIYHFGSK
ncbi:MAG: hypothetical protein AAFX87_31790 [Bacteroidota bacterium]